MRDFLNAILSTLGTGLLTDPEFNSLTIQSAAWDTQTYSALDVIVAQRDSVSDLRQRLSYIFQAKGVSVEPIKGQSNIFIGAAL